MNHRLKISLVTIVAMSCFDVCPQLAHALKPLEHLPQVSDPAAPANPVPTTTTAPVTVEYVYKKGKYAPQDAAVKAFEDRVFQASREWQLKADADSYEAKSAALGTGSALALVKIGEGKLTFIPAKSLREEVKLTLDGINQGLRRYARKGVYAGALRYVLELEPWTEEAGRQVKFTSTAASDPIDLFGAIAEAKSAPLQAGVYLGKPTVQNEEQTPFVLGAVAWTKVEEKPAPGGVTPEDAAVKLQLRLEIKNTTGGVVGVAYLGINEETARLEVVKLVVGDKVGTEVNTPKDSNDQAVSANDVKLLEQGIALDEKQLAEAQQEYDNLNGRYFVYQRQYWGRVDQVQLGKMQVRLTKLQATIAELKNQLVTKRTRLVKVRALAVGTQTDNSQAERVKLKKEITRDEENLGLMETQKVAITEALQRTGSREYAMQMRVLMDAMKELRAKIADEKAAYAKLSEQNDTATAGQQRETQDQMQELQAYQGALGNLVFTNNNKVMCTLAITKSKSSLVRP